MSKPTMIDEEDNVQKIFWSCPVKFIPDSIWSFLSCKAFHEKHPSAVFPSIDDVSPRYSAAETLFDYELSRCIMEGT